MRPVRKVKDGCYAEDNCGCSFKEEDAGSKSIHFRGKAKILGHLQCGIANVDSIEEGDDIKEEQVWQDMSHDAPPRTLSYRRQEGRLTEHNWSSPNQCDQSK